jgi:hypothetical protein
LEPFVPLLCFVVFSYFRFSFVSIAIPHLHHPCQIGELLYL